MHAVPGGHLLAGADLADRLGQGTLGDLDTLLDGCANIVGRSFCALGDAAATPITCALKYFRDEFEDL